jgi:hypothetical protein
MYPGRAQYSRTSTLRNATSKHPEEQVFSEVMFYVVFSGSPVENSKNLERFFIEAC